MNKTKRTVTTILLCAMLVASFAACSGGAREDDDDSPANGDLITVGFSQVGAESDWRKADTKSMKESFSEENGYNLIFKDAQQKQSSQIEAIEGFIADKVDYIIFAPVTETGWDEVLQKARDAEIPVIIIDRRISTADEDLYTCWIGSDFEKEGITAIEWIENAYGDADLSIAHLQGTMGSSAQIGRTNGLEEGLKNNPNWHISAEDCGDFTAVKGKELMERFLKENTDIDLLFCENDDMAIGAIDALEDAGISYGTQGHIKIISFDATTKGLEYTLSGAIALNVECNPLLGPSVEEVVRMLEDGETPDKQTFVEEKAFETDTLTQETVDARSY